MGTGTNPGAGTTPGTGTTPAAGTTPGTGTTPAAGTTPGAGGAPPPPPPASSRNVRIVAGVLWLVIVGYYANIVFRWIPDVWIPDPIADGILFVGLMLLTYAVLTGRTDVWNTVIGHDRRASTSKFQPAIWTVVFTWGLVAILGARMREGGTGGVPELPENVLVVIGLSVGTGIAAKLITTSKVDSGQEVKAPAGRVESLGPLVLDDDGFPDLSKTETLAFTFVALSAFIGAVLIALGSPTPTMGVPDIDTTLLVLMGVGTAAYLGRKVIPSRTTVVNSISKDEVSLGAQEPERWIAIGGEGFGTTRGTSAVTLDGTPLQSPVELWSDTSIKVLIPAAKPTGEAWRMGAPLEVRVVVGEPSATFVYLRLLV